MGTTPESLLSVIDRDVTSQFNPPRSPERLRADQSASAATGVTMLAVAALTGSVIGFIPGNLNAAFAFTSKLHSLLLIAAVILTAAAIWLWWLHARARRRAQEAHVAALRAFRRAAIEGAQSALARNTAARTSRGAPATTSRGTRGRPVQGITPEEAEQFVMRWMHKLGDAAARTTQYVGDGGIDVASRRYIAQVKHFSSNVGVAAIREFAGVAGTDGRAPLFFTRTGYAPGAMEFATAAGIALFVYDDATNTVTASNSLGHTYLANGLH